MRIYPTFNEKSFEKGTFKPKIEKMSQLLFLLSLFRYLQEKNIANFSPSSLGDHLVLTSQTDDICFS